MSKVIDFPGSTTLDTPPDKVLSNAQDKLKSVIVLGWRKDGELYLASSGSKLSDLTYLHQCMGARINRIINEAIDEGVQ